MPTLNPLAHLRARWSSLRGWRPRIRTGRSRLAALESGLLELSANIEANHDRVMHALRIVRDDDASARATLWDVRRTDEYAQAFEEDEPLVTVIITTYRNWEMLGERALPSVLAQTYARFETIVVGDAAPPEAADVVRSFGDDRLRFVNLPYRGPYPKSAADGWFVSGTTPWNTGLAMASGRWIGSTSDDDALRPTYLEALLSLARKQRAEVAYGQLQWCEPSGEGRLLGCFPPEHGHWGTQSSLIHAALRFLPLQPTDWLFRIPNDWSLAERMLRIGVRFAMLEEPVVDYYPSSLWTDRLQRTEY